MTDREILQGVKDYWVATVLPRMELLNPELRAEDITKIVKELIKVCKNKPIDGYILEHSCEEISYLTVTNLDSCLRPLYNKFLCFCRVLLHLSTQDSYNNILEQKEFIPEVDCTNASKVIVAFKQFVEEGLKPGGLFDVAFTKLQE